MHTLRHTLACGAALIALLILSAPAFASTVSFTDTSKVWPGFNAKAGEDVHGIPDILSGEVSGHGGLDYLSITYQSDYALRQGSKFKNLTDYGKLWNQLDFGNIFINTDPSANNDWDIIIQATSGNQWTIYSVVVPYVNNDYIMSSSPSGTPRTGHPVAIDLSSYDAVAIGTATYSGWQVPAGAGVDTPVTSSWLFSLFEGYSWNFLEDTFILGLTVTCANDVLYQRIAVPTPEPSTWLLFGIGLAALLFFKRHRDSREA
ncbi:PEP-CTERM sorting domain-containing protein [Desulfovibrio psychrotolerans]|uniref:Ice-binding protein C-terminal domain-containing protein n=1 Tax=Desulfovibrio psychrotolerans TaxID=415242 RepID=A0A7J0BVU6_9BACT|nr:PEP-CTERM sorting domain-containing protein [Desulfovibrio psychrotolerans]GFM37292.1 hypothetical protein DSM19430T_19760 [Desulfovibrio psychrotolerans]